MPSCDKFLSNCENLETRVVFKGTGICLEIRHDKAGGEPTTSDSVQESFQMIRRELPSQVRISSESSMRLGHPVITMKYFGDSYLCDSQWSHNEAQVMCKEMGFESGIKFYKTVPSPSTKLTYAKYLGKFQCSGDESSLEECSSTVISHCESSEKMSMLMCDVGGLSGVHKKTKVRGHPYVEGATADKYFCGGDQFTSREATVFCRMLGWSSGRSSVTSTDLSLSEETLSVQCQGETTQCNVCLKY